MFLESAEGKTVSGLTVDYDPTTGGGIHQWHYGEKFLR